MTAPAGEGIPGFSGRDLPLAAGSVTGVRLWHVDMTSAEAATNGAPAPAEGRWSGVFGGVWRRGGYVATCGGGTPWCPRRKAGAGSGRTGPGGTPGAATTTGGAR